METGGVMGLSGFKRNLAIHVPGTFVSLQSSFSQAGIKPLRMWLHHTHSYVRGQCFGPLDHPASKGNFASSLATPNP